MERKPPVERYAWIKTALSRKAGDTLAAHLLQAWLLGAQKPMLCDFLDSLGIDHDEDGTVENLPESPPKEKLGASIDQLLVKYPAETVAVYLHAFHDMDSTVSWPPLGEVLAEDERLRLGARLGFRFLFCHPELRRQRGDLTIASHVSRACTVALPMRGPSPCCAGSG